MASGKRSKRSNKRVGTEQGIPYLLTQLRRKVKLGGILLIAAALIFIGFATYFEIIRPNQSAHSYTHRLTSASQPLEDCFDKLAETTGLSIYYAPDVSFAAKQSDTTAILKQIRTCREQLKQFDRAAHELLQLRFADYTPTYHEAKVSQKQAFDVVGQSNDVLNQYEKLATFLAGYYGHMQTFVTYTAALNTEGSYFSSARLKKLAGQADDLRTQAARIQEAPAPAEFKPTKDATSATLTKAASGLDMLVLGYTNTNDTMVNNGFAAIDSAVAEYDSTIILLPFGQLTTSYIPKQVIQLPSKVSNLLSGAME